MFVCVFAKKFPALASQSCCEVSCPRAVGEYEYRLLGNGRKHTYKSTGLGHINSHLFNPGVNICLTCFITGSAAKHISLVSTALCKIPLEHQINKFLGLLDDDKM